MATIINIKYPQNKIYKKVNINYKSFKAVE